MKVTKNYAPYVHHCASMKQIQVSFRYLMDEKNHRPPSTSIGSLVRAKYPSTCCTTAYEHYCTGPTPHLVHRAIYDKSKGHRRTCPVCSGSDARRRASRSYHELHAFDWKRLRHMELTAPGDYVTREDNDKTIALKMAEFFKMCRAWMDQCFPGEAYIFFFHHWASSDPLGPPHFHMHIIASCTTYKRDEKRRIIKKHLNPRLSCNELDGLRDVWRGLLGHEGNVNVFYRYAPRWPKGKFGGPTRLLHRLTYCYRAYIQDVNAFTMAEGFTLTDEQDYWLTWHMRKWGRRIRRYGAYSPTQQKEFIRMEHVEIRVEADAEKAKTLYCPVCLYPISPRSRSNDPVPLVGAVLAVREVISPRRPPTHLMYQKTPSWIGKKSTRACGSYRQK